MPADRLSPLDTGAVRRLGDDPVRLGVAAYEVVEGMLGLYASAPGRAGSRRLAETFPAGEIIFALPPHPAMDVSGFALAPETAIRSLDMPAFLGRLDAGDPAAMARMEAFIERMARAFAEPEAGRVVSIAEETESLPPNTSVRPQKGLLWIEVMQGDVSPDLDPAHLLQAGAPPAPLSAASPGAMHAVQDPADVICRDSRALAREGQLAIAFGAHLARVSGAIAASLVAAANRAAERVRTAPARDRAAAARPFAALGGKRAPASDGDADALTEAFLQVAQANAVEVSADALSAATATEADTPEDRLAALALASRLRVRPLRLSDGWQRGGQSLILFTQSQARPLAAIARSGWRSGYDIYEADGTPWAGRTEHLSDIAYAIQRPLPDGPVDGKAMLRFALPLAGPLALPVLMVALFAGLLGLVTPIGTEILFDTVIPSSSVPQLLQLVGGLAALGVGMTVFELVRGFLLLRMTTLVNADLEGAIWDRLLRLPATFFRSYTAGDLALRAAAINQMRDTIGGAVLNTLLSAVFSVTSLCLLIYYSWKLAAISAVLVGLQVAVTIVSSLLMISMNRQALATDGRLQALSLQILTAIGKLRVAGAESRAFGRWASLFLDRRSLDFRKHRLSVAVETVGAVLGVLSTGVLIGAVGFGLTDIGIAQFVAFNAAFGQFLSAALSLTGVVPALLTLGTLYERAAPLLRTTPEDGGRPNGFGVLRGEVEFHNVTFRYDADGPLVLDGVSLRARPGEFIAIVGPSGAGKSSVLRLLLGFDKPSSGAIFFDHQDAASIDLRAVRRQMGVVLQNGHAATGSILDNILGGAPLTESDAWAAAHLAGLDEDILQMPMRMHTFAGENGTLLSGGQRQRLLIARAVVRRPNLLLFDEATSALDNRSQQIVTDRLSDLKATRIVVAHRLSTIMAADRIYVLEAGRVVEEGTYEELMERDGVFTELARRHIS
ncbi:NHLP bacteriocin export ABC transporter permease/ATPase subunit [Aquabacter sp. L1I39]|uniref:NHLP bacteriocin export ABC transporter permease/ATPase subunit n=1 Tax=Aquabacter sp. L1I39 TaxID=2820278 RepID=UPI001ADAB4ED|nr:NHLP bacteriocin export ABC transporter permease/ATPase subunit [Aquabacter sp. L1I39]QTL01863.1 NHLP bacteriocin export ABC transporter permease/ATPase subunit [Aquabacter sp. L1I39]